MISMKTKWMATLIVAFSVLSLSSCKDKPHKKDLPNEVVIQISSDPGSLNPITYQGNNAGVILGQVIQNLTTMDFKTLEEVPLLAKSRAKIEEIKEGMYKGGLSLTYELREEAAWDNGKPITVEDIDFSLKAIKNPLVNAEALRPSFDQIDSISFDKSNPRKFTLYSKEKFIRAESADGSFPVLSAAVYDPEGLMKNYTVHQLNNPKNGERLKKETKLAKFAETFNSEKFQHEAANIIGSGAYKIKEWASGQRVVLERKKDWWGNKLKPENTAFEAYPDKITYKVINDPNAALTELKAGKIDALSQIPGKDFTELMADTHFTARYKLHTPPDLTYCFISMNMKNSILKDLEVRKAFAHLLDIDKIIKTVMYGLAYPTVSMEHPSRKTEYNSDIKRLPYNPEEAQKLLTEAGWKDKNADGILTKKINGKNTPLHLTLLVNAGNTARAQIAQIFKEEARKIGVDIDVQIQDLMTMIKNEVNHQFDMGFGAWQGVPLPADPKETWYSESANGGHNFSYFGTNETDKLIDSIRTELDNTKRIKLYKRFQAEVYEQMPYLFLYAYKGKIAINKKFENADPSTLRPGYNEAGFRLSGE